MAASRCWITGAFVSTRQFLCFNQRISHSEKSRPVQIKVKKKRSQCFFRDYSELLEKQNYNFRQRIVDKFTKLSKKSFSMECFAVGFL